MSSDAPPKTAAFVCAATQLCATGDVDGRIDIAPMLIPARVQERGSSGSGAARASANGVSAATGAIDDGPRLAERVARVGVATGVETSPSPSLATAAESSSSANVSTIGGGAGTSGGAAGFFATPLPAWSAPNPLCDPLVSQLKGPDGKEVYLVGTAHISQESAALVRNVIRAVKPDTVMIELDASAHPFFVACQFHPEFKSRPTAPHPLFSSFVEAAVAFKHRDR